MKSISEFISLRIFQDTKIPQTPKQQFMKELLSWEFGVFLGYAPGEMFVSHDLCQERMELQLGGYGVGYRGMCRFRCRWNKFGRGGMDLSVKCSFQDIFSTIKLEEFVHCCEIHHSTHVLIE